LLSLEIDLLLEELEALLVYREFSKSSTIMEMALLRYKNSGKVFATSDLNLAKMSADVSSILSM
jgi:hypothetical protein